MGQLTIDHRGTINPDGTKGTLVTMDTVLCKHCAKIIAVIVGPVKEYEGKHRCQRCAGPICRECSTLPCNPFMARVEHAIENGGWDEKWQYQYRILPN